ncbi:hypothetical protein RFI_08152 [Reticulomyxa filosa]|uniref:Ammonium transporter AmtB-like domain-containing protein n=1 Tax=Reticulomyxa filosa TaxID=46433 RepID=X6NTA5_RETFI|nr:hypothetical protein RFI_08152 [Reticulomyxa filosa]|eukprot:ETO28974.1 hypothetical protein RFI_08152 [Reticulomyxa filosa]
MLVGLLADANLTGAKGNGIVFGWDMASLKFFGVQVLGTVVGMLWSGVWTYILFRTMRKFVNIDINAETELEGLDRKQIGEKSYRFAEMSRHHVLTFELCSACKIGDFREVLRIEKKKQPQNSRIIATSRNATVNMLDYDDRTALHISCCYNQIDVAELLLKCGALVDVVDR